MRGAASSLALWKNTLSGHVEANGGDWNIEHIADGLECLALGHTLGRLGQRCLRASDTLIRSVTINGVAQKSQGSVRQRGVLLLRIRHAERQAGGAAVRHAGCKTVVIILRLINGHIIMVVLDRRVQIMLLLLLLLMELKLGPAKGYINCSLNWNLTQQIRGKDLTLMAAAARRSSCCY